MKKLLISLICLFAVYKGTAQDIIIRNVNIIPMTSDTVLKSRTVWIQNGIIRQIGQSKDIADVAGATVVNGKGKFLMPGLADMHVHLPVAASVDTMLTMQVAAGVTHIRVMNSKMPQADLMQRLKDHPEAIAPKVHFSVLVNRNMKYSEAQCDSLLGVVKSGGYDFVKLFSLSDDVMFDNLMRSAARNQVTVCGHYPFYQKDGKWTWMDIHKVLNSGFRSIEHLNGYDRIDTPQKLRDAAILTASQQVYNCPTMDYRRMAYDLLYPDAYKQRITYRQLPAPLIRRWEEAYAAGIKKAGGPDSVLAAQKRYKPDYEKNQKILKTLSDLHCPLLLGSDGDNTFQAPGFNVYEEMVAWHDAGIDNYTILRSATVEPAAFFNASARWGTIEQGKEGDVILLSGNPLTDIRNIGTVQTTILRGRIYRKADLLKSLF